MRFINRIIMKKRGQIGYFIIAGIVLLIIAGLVLYTSSTIKEKKIVAEAEKQQQLEAESKNIRNLIESCISKTAYEGLKIAGKTGGYIEVPQKIDLNGISYWYFDQINIQPTLDQIRQRIILYIDENLPLCLNYSTFEQQGMQLEYTEPKSNITFAADDVIIDLHYPITITKQEYETTEDKFSSRLDVRFRRIYEAGSKIINLQLEPDFNFFRPIEKIEAPGFDVSYASPDNETLIYTIIDKTRFEKGEYFSLSFASRFRRSNLIRTIELQENSNIVSTLMPFTIYSLDRMAQLLINPGTTMNLNGSSVDNITAQQFYPENVTRENVPLHEGDDTVEYGSLSYKLTYPVYQFEPTGMRFNNPQRLVLYWDEEKTPHKGNVGILWNEGNGWRPLMTRADYENNFVYTDIPGFSEYTVVDCGEQEVKTASANAKVDPGSGCWVKMIVIVIIIIIILVITLFCPLLGTGLWSTFGSALIGGATLAGSWALAMAVCWGIVLGGIAGGAYLNAEMMNAAGDDSITFTPTCDHTTHISKQESGGSGSCIPMGEVDAKAGEPITVQAQMGKCSGTGKWLCGKCSVKCTARYE